jgi:predicted acylesterase/phospholipase RssA
LNFELTTTDDKGKITTHDASVIVKRVHRAIIFQGGVSLGAYEAGVFQALVEKLSEEDETKRNLKNEKRPLFDIVAGTSIGAMNAAVVVSNIIEGKSWKDASNKLVEFWQDQEYPLPTVADSLDNGYNDTMNEVEDFIIEVESIPDRVDNLSLKEEKILLIHSAKLFQEIIKRTKKCDLLPQIF